MHTYLCYCHIANTIETNEFAESRSHGNVVTRRQRHLEITLKLVVYRVQVGHFEEDRVDVLGRQSVLCRLQQRSQLLYELHQRIVDDQNYTTPKRNGNRICR